MKLSRFMQPVSSSDRHATNERRHDSGAAPVDVHMLGIWVLVADNAGKCHLYRWRTGHWVEVGFVELTEKGRLGSHFGGSAELLGSCLGKNAGRKLPYRNFRPDLRET